MRRIRLWGVGLLFVLAAWSTARADTLVMRDGSRHEGEFVSGTTRIITFRENGRLIQYHREDIDTLYFGERQQSQYPPSSYNNNNGHRDQAGPPPDNGYRQQGGPPPDNGYRDNGDRGGDRRDVYVIARGTPLVIRTNETIDSDWAVPAEAFSAQIDQDVLDENGQVIVPRGSHAQLVIRKVRDTPRGPELALDVDTITVGDRTYSVDTADVEAKGNSGLGANRRTGEYVGGGSILGAIVGGIVGGGKGAAIGAVAGAGAGAGAQVLTQGTEVRVPAESALTFRLDRPVRLHLRES